MPKRTLQQTSLLLAPGETLSDDTVSYRIDGVLSVGATAAVYRATETGTGRKVALKEFAKATRPCGQLSPRARFERECEVARVAGSHPLVPTVFSAFTVDGRFYLAQEFIEGVALRDLLSQRRTLPPPTVARYAVLLCEVLAFLHEHHFVLHELTPANILITPRGYPLIFDFGAARPSQEADDVRADLRALGALLCTLIGGDAPDSQEDGAEAPGVPEDLASRLPADSPLLPIIERALTADRANGYAAAGDMAQDLRRIAPPALLPSVKRLHFEEAALGEPLALQTVVLTNVGGGEIHGVAQPLDPWIQVEPGTFVSGQTLAVRVDVSQLPQRGSWVTGRVEMRGGAGETPDRWLLECLVKALPRPGSVRVRGVTDDRPLTFKARPGQPPLALLELENTGDTPVAFELRPHTSPEALPGPTLALSVPGGVLAPAQVARIVVTAEGALPSTVYRSGLTVTTAAGQCIEVPLVLTPAPAGPKPPLPVATPQSPPHFKGEPDIMPKATVLRWGVVLAAIVLVLGYFLGRSRMSQNAATVAATAPSVQALPPVLPARAPAEAVQSVVAGNVLKPTPDASNWTLEQNNGAVASVSVQGDALHVTVAKAGAKYWQVQLYQIPHGLQTGRTYLLTFQARANSACDLPVGSAYNGGDYHPVGLTRHFLLSKEWQTFTQTFVTQNLVGDNNRIPVFMIGTKPHQYWIRDVVLRRSR